MFDTPYRWRFAILACLFAAFAAAPVAAQSDGLEATIAAAHRTPVNVARDRYRHPLETLRFFGIEPDMTVVEIWPGGGVWYMQILAPYLKDRGHYIAAGFPRDTQSKFLRRINARIDALISDHADLYGAVALTEFGPGRYDIAPPGSADMVLTFRNVHNWLKGGYAADAFVAFYRALKPGGVLGLVEHRADPAKPEDPQALSGYTHESQVLRLAEGAGFRLVARSEVNANPRDTRDHPNGVWTLPPVRRGDDANNDRYMAIGESDRMTLKFVKPAE